LETTTLSRFRPRIQEKSFLPAAFAASAAIHGLIYFLGYAAPRPAHAPVELDLTMSGHLGTAGGAHHSAPKAAPAPPPAPKAAEKDWVKASANKPAPIAAPSATPSPAPAPETPAPSAAANANESSGGFGEGDGDLTSLTRYPAILNLSDLGVILRRFYPEAERDAGHEGIVVVDLHVDVDGRVTSVDVVRSSAPDFADAAVRAARLLRFSPAYRGAEKVAVKLRQAIKFNLEK
jgi:protein TonB